jgi:hypothetical protein
VPTGFIPLLFEDRLNQYTNLLVVPRRPRRSARPAD